MARQHEFKQGLSQSYSGIQDSAERICNEDSGMFCTSCTKWRPFVDFPASSKKHRHRNATLECNFCLKLIECVQCKDWKAPTQYRTARGQTLNVCKICLGIWCSTCEEMKGTEEHSSQQINNHSSHGKRVCCQICTGKGLKPQDGKKPKTLKVCETCGAPRDAFKDFRKVQGTYQAVCFSCEIVACKACGNKLQKSQLDPKKVNKYFNGQPVICASCHKQGCTSKDPRLHACTDCGAKWGRTKYIENQIRNFLERGGLLVCNACREREARIRKALRAPGSWKCTCKLPIHSEKCRLVSTSVDRRWPGMNKGVTENDWEFWKARKR